jgi:hypothetical protein
MTDILSSRKFNKKRSFKLIMYSVRYNSYASNLRINLAELPVKFKSSFLFVARCTRQRAI